MAANGAVDSGSTNRVRLLDTDILSELLQHHPHVTLHAHEYLKRHRRLTFSVVTYYEILGGLMHRDRHKRLKRFLDFVGISSIIPLEHADAKAAALFYQRSRVAGHPIDDMDLLIAGTAQAHNMILVTNNTRHFASLGMQVENWKQG